MNIFNGSLRLSNLRFLQLIKGFGGSKKVVIFSNLSVVGGYLVSWELSAT
jgi:hypothetical protein